MYSFSVHALSSMFTQTKPPKPTSRRHLAQARVLLAEALLVALLAARDVDAVALRVERPRVEDARHALRVADGIVEQRVAAVRADVVEAPHLHVLAADDDQRCAARVSESAVVEGVRNLDSWQAMIQHLLKIFSRSSFEELLVGVDPAVDEMRRRKLGLLMPQGCVFRHKASSDNLEHPCTIRAITRTFHANDFQHVLS